jgi:Holliday junction resolvase-like predicted endonuclease
VPAVIGMPLFSKLWFDIFKKPANRASHARIGNPLLVPDEQQKLISVFVKSRRDGVSSDSIRGIVTNKRRSITQTIVFDLWQRGLRCRIQSLHCFQQPNLTNRLLRVDPEIERDKVQPTMMSENLKIQICPPQMLELV